MAIDINNGYQELSVHAGHMLECVMYGNEENVAIECLTCGEVLLDFNKEGA